ncbi:T9SS type A sorting domain-containing protein [Bernardetia sp. MNP-M8]|uniref:T9SS type A sorting domain-containing protein n=1 Tax=Bernardetia sp. MNP-M8 TaxID=3127470 RepID=UPI0030D1C88A
MKQIFQTFKLLVLACLFLGVSQNIFAQVTITSSIPVTQFTGCGALDVDCNQVSGSQNINTYKGDEIRWRVSNINESTRTVTFQAVKCNSTAFIGSGEFNIRSTICDAPWLGVGNNYASTTFNSGSILLTVSYTFPSNFTGSQTFKGVLESNVSDAFTHARTPDIVITVTNVAPEPCNTPTGTTEANITTTSAILNWDTMANRNDYTVQWREMGGTWQIVTTSTSSYRLDNLLTPSTTYQWRVRTNCTGNTSLYTANRTFTTDAACDIPTNTYEDNLTATSVSLDWSSVSSSNFYNVRHREQGTSSWIVDAPTSSNLPLSGLYQNTTYEWQVRSHCPSENSDYSPIRTFTTEVSCDIPTGTTENNITTSSADLDWNTISSANFYNLRHREQGTSSWIVDVPTSSNFSLTGLAANTTYEWQVRSDCGANESSYSFTRIFSTPPPCEALPAYSVSATEGNCNEVVLTIQDVFRQVPDRWVIMRDGTQIAVIPSNELEYTDTNLLDENIHTYEVFGQNSNCQNDLSSPVSTQGYAHLSNPFDINQAIRSGSMEASDGTFSDRIEVQLPALKRNYQYEIFRVNSSGVVELLVPTTIFFNDQVYYDNNVVVGEEYTYRARAYNDCMTPSNDYIIETGYAGSLQNNILEVSAVGLTNPVQNGGTVDVGSIEVGRTKDVPIYLINNNSTQLSISSTTLENPFYLANPITSATNIGIGGNYRLLTQFSPTSTGRFSKTLTIEYENQTFFITLTGEGTDRGTLDITPVNCTETFAFPNIEVGNTIEQEFVLTARGQPVTVQAVGLSAISSTFEFVGGVPSQTTLQVGESLSVRIVARPTSVGLHNGVLVIISNASAISCEIQLEVTATSPPPPTADLALKANDVTSNQNEVEQSYTLEGDNTPLASYLTFRVTYTGVTEIVVLPSLFAVSHRIVEIAPNVLELRAVVSSTSGSTFGLTSGDELLKVKVTRSSTAEDCIPAEITRVAAIDEDRNRLDIESENGTICKPTLADITVRVKTADGKPVNNTRVIVEGQTYTTNANGEVVLPHLLDTEFSALVEKDNFTTPHADFVEILDIAIANDLVIADEGEFSSFIKIAGDVNKDNENFLEDIDMIINAFFGDTFPWNDTPDWVFTTIDAATNPFSPRYAEGIPARTITENTTIEVTAIALGDLDFEYARPTDRIEILPLYVERKVEKLQNEEYKVSFITTNTADVEIFSARFEGEGKELTSQVFDLKHRSRENKLVVLGMDSNGKDRFVDENTILLSFITKNPDANVTSFEYVNENKIPYPILLKTDSEEGEERIDEIVIFPNPNKGNFFIQSPEVGFISITDATGRTIFETEIEAGKNQITIPNAAKGMYNLIISSPSFSTVKKIVIE